MHQTTNVLPLAKISKHLSKLGCEDLAPEILSVNIKDGSHPSFSKESICKFRSCSVVVTLA